MLSNASADGYGVNSPISEAERLAILDHLRAALPPEKRAAILMLTRAWSPDAGVTHCGAGRQVVRLAMDLTGRPARPVAPIPASSVDPRDGRQRHVRGRSRLPRARSSRDAHFAADEADQEQLTIGPLRLHPPPRQLLLPAVAERALGERRASEPAPDRQNAVGQLPGDRVAVGVAQVGVRAAMGGRCGIGIGPTPLPAFPVTRLIRRFTSPDKGNTLSIAARPD